MKRITCSLSALVAGTLLAAPPALRAEQGHDHGKHDHAGHDHGAAADTGAVPGSQAGMAALRRHVGEMEAELAAGKLDGIHGHDEAIQAAVKGLDRDTALTAEKRKRVQGYVKNVLRLSGRLHAAADGDKLDQAKKDIVKLKAQVDLLDRQFGPSRKPGSAPAGKAAESHPVHPHPGK